MLLCLKKTLFNSGDFFPAALALSILLHLLTGILITFWPQKEPLITFPESLSVKVVLGGSKLSLKPEEIPPLTPVQKQTAMPETPPLPDPVAEMVKQVAAEEKQTEKTSKTILPESTPVQSPIVETAQPVATEEKHIEKINETGLPGAADQSINTQENDTAGIPETAGRQILTALEELPGLKGERSLPAPPYPETARRFGHKGSVLVEIVINSNGSIKSVVIVKSDAHSILENICLKTIKRKWKFFPPGREITTRKEFLFLLE